MADQNNPIQIVIGVIVAIAGLWYFFGGGLEMFAAKNLQQIHNQVANDFLKQYEIAKRNGTPIDVCVQAGMVAAAYLQAKDEANYGHWKQRESEDCRRAGLPR